MFLICLMRAVVLAITKLFTFVQMPSLQNNTACTPQPENHQQGLESIENINQRRIRRRQLRNAIGAQVQAPYNVDIYRPSTQRQ